MHAFAHKGMIQNGRLLLVSSSQHVSNQLRQALQGSAQLPLVHVCLWILAKQLTGAYQEAA